MRWTRSILASAILSAALVVPQAAQASQLLVNPGFETGTFAGWTPLTGAGAQLTPWAVSGPGGGWFGSTSPQSGSFDAFNGFDGDAGLTYGLYQDVLIPAGSTATLTTNHRIVYDSLEIASTLPRVFEIQVRNTSNAVLFTLFSQSILLNGAGHTDTGWITGTFNLSSLAGSTVRIFFSESIPETFTGPANLQLDNITLEAVPEPASLFLLGSGLVAGARAIRRRKQA